mmetsp:Transcript_24384/g.54543  ORF Transcript_24384/g.54543 Transcript_24384/m.54543 type:complete len:355 (+) Transcript_24384:235-1299(+)
MKGSSARLLLLLPLSAFRAAAAFVPVPAAAIKSLPSQRRSSVQELHSHAISEIVAHDPLNVGAGVAIGILGSGIKVIQEGDVAIVERLGKFNQQLEPGLHYLIPFVDIIRTRLTRREQVLDIPPQKCITSDNAPLLADAVVYWRIFDPERAIYAVEDLSLAIQTLVLTQLRAEIGKLTLDMTFSAREQINNVLLEELDVATNPWGVKITRVEVQEIMPNTEILRAMEMQMAAERQKRADVIKSEGERQKSINEAEGEARSRIIDAEAEAKSLVLEAEAEAKKLEMEAKGVAKALDAIAGEMTRAEAARFQLMREYIASQRELATSENAKVIVTGGGGDVEDAFAKAIAFYNMKD